MKISRNAPCPCGNGNKYEKCHFESDRGLLEPRPGIEAVIARFRAEQQKQAQLQSSGYFLPHIQSMFKGKRVRAVGKRIYYDLPIEQTFHEFLIGILSTTLGPKWVKDQLALSESEQHFIAQSYAHFQDWKKSNAKPDNKEGDHWGSVPDGWTRSLVALAFDVYCLQHRARLPVGLLNRLKDRNQYQGARYEIAIAAIFTRLGFKINFLDGHKSPGRRCEFIARHEEKGIAIAVEAKSRHRRGVLHYRGTVTQNELLKGNVRGLLESAAGQNPGDIPFMIFVDLNVPRTSGQGFPDKPWFEDLQRSVDVFKQGTEDEPELFNAIVVTNYPFHYDADRAAGVGEFLFVVPLFTKHQLDPTVLELLRAGLDSYGNVPDLE